MRKIPVLNLENTPPVSPSDLKAAIDLTVTLGVDQPDSAWLDLLHKGLLATWDNDKSLALWARSKALLRWAATPEVVEADALSRIGWLAREARREGAPLQHPALLDWTARVRAASTYPLTAAGQLDATFQQAVTEVKAAMFEGPGLPA